MKRKHKIFSCFIDTKANLSVMGAFQIIQDAITELTGEHKFDGITLKEKYNAFWVFTKTRVKFIKNVVWNEEIDVRAFISYISVAKMNVDVEMKDKFGNIISYSRTEMCALDLDTQRIRKISTVGVTEDVLEKQVPMEILFTKFEGSELPIVDNIKVKYTNIDFSHHTNNLEYVRFIMNTYTVEEVEQRGIKEVEIIYANQSFENDVLDIRKSGFENKDLIVLEKDGKPVVKCEIVF